MFASHRGPDIEIGYLRSGGILWSGKRRRTASRRGSWNMTRGEEYDLMSHFYEGSCKEEEEYQLISEEEEEA